MAETTPSGQQWPRLSLITPSYNQGRFLEETIRSVLLQGYPDLEYFIIDGGSTDNSVEIIRKYEPWLTYWTSEPDRGQAHAINKGLSRVTGTLWGWINSDDLLIADSLAAVADLHHQFPNDLVAGDVLDFWDGEKKTQLIKQGDIDLRKFVEFWNRDEHWHQPGIFFPVSLIQKIGSMDESLRYLFDYDLLCRALSLTQTRYLDRPVASFRLHPGSKTVSEGDLFLFELCRISKRYWHSLPDPDVAGYRRHASGLLFCTGCRRLVRGQGRALRLITEGLKTHPFWAVFAAIKLLPSWRKRRHQEASERKLESTTRSISKIEGVR